MRMLEVALVEEMLVTYALNALWQVPLLCVAAAGAAQLMQRASVGAVHRMFVAALLLAVLLPAVPVALGMRARSVVAPSVDAQASRASAGRRAIAAAPVLDFDVMEAPTARPLARQVNWGALAVRVLAWAYGLSVMVAMLRLLWALGRTKWLEKRASEVVFTAALRAIWERCCAHFETRGVRVLGSDQVTSPATMSLPRAVVLLPLGMARGKARAVGAALAHELAHVQRRDFAKNIGYEAATAAVWFHPGAHWLRRRVGESRELVCDELAADALEGRAAYAGSLVRLAEQVVGETGAQGRALGVLDGDVLERRIMKLIEAKVQQAGWRAAVSAVCGVALLAGSLAVGTRFGVRPVFAKSRAAVMGVAKDVAPAMGSALTGARLRELVATNAAPVDIESSRTEGLLSAEELRAPVVEMAEQTTDNADLQPVPFKLGQVTLAGGDKITIEAIRGTQKTIELENLYEVKGTYTLASADKATLAINVTTSSKSNGRKDYGMGPQRMTVQKGSGRFTLWFYMLNDGDPHLSFYPAGGAGGSFASVYFQSVGSSGVAGAYPHTDSVEPHLPESLKGWILVGSNPAAYKVWVERPGGHDGGSKAVLASRTAEEVSGFGTIMQAFDAAQYRGKRVRLRAWVKTEDVKHWAGLWMRVDKSSGDESKSIAFDNMEKRPISGTTEWTAFDVVLDVAKEASTVNFGILLDGPGQVELSALKFEVVGQDVAVTDMMAGDKLASGPVNLEMRK